MTEPCTREKHGLLSTNPTEKSKNMASDRPRNHPIPRGLESKNIDRPSGPKICQHIGNLKPKLFRQSLIIADLSHLRQKPNKSAE